MLHTALLLLVMLVQTEVVWNMVSLSLTSGFGLRTLVLNGSLMVYFAWRTSPIGRMFGCG